MGFSVQNIKNIPINFHCEDISCPIEDVKYPPAHYAVEFLIDIPFASENFKVDEFLPVSGF